MMRRAIALMSILSGAALSGCTGIPSMPSFSVPSFKMPTFSMPGFNQPGIPVHVSSVPPGAEASFGNGGESCRTPCTLAAPNGTGTYNLSFTLEGYQPHSIPVRVAVNEGGSLRAGTSATTVISPNPVFAELEPVAPAASAAAKRPPAARTKPPAKPVAAKPATTTAATAPSGSASSPPPPAPPALPSPLGTPAPATSPNVFR
jgi:hypothetical protein